MGLSAQVKVATVQICLRIVGPLDGTHCTVGHNDQLAGRQELFCWAIPVVVAVVVVC